MLLKCHTLKQSSDRASQGTDLVELWGPRGLMKLDFVVQLLSDDCELA
jgi:hypothetical protein